MAYVLIVERLERAVLAERQVCAVFMAAGVKQELPDLEERRAAFDKALEDEPTAIDADEELLRALGVR